MNELKLTKEGKAFVVGFKGANGQSAAGPLGERSEADLKEFLIMAHRSRADYVALFDNPPGLQELLKEKADAQLKAGPPAEAYAANPATLPVGVGHKMAAPAAPDSAAEAPAPAAAPKASTAPAETQPDAAAGKAPTK